VNIFFALASGGVALMPLLRGDLSVSLFFAALGAAVLLQVVLIFLIGKPGTARGKFGLDFVFMFIVPLVTFHLVSIPFAGTLLAAEFSVFFFLCGCSGYEIEDPARIGGRFGGRFGGCARLLAPESSLGGRCSLESS